MAPDGLYGTLGDWDEVWLLLGALEGLGGGEPCMQKWPRRGRKRPRAQNAPNTVLHHNSPIWHLMVCMVLWVFGMGYGYRWGLWESWGWGALHAKMAR